MYDSTDSLFEDNASHLCDESFDVEAHVKAEEVELKFDSTLGI